MKRVTCTFWCIMICLVILILSLLLFIQSLYSLSKLPFTCVCSNDLHYNVLWGQYASELKGLMKKLLFNIVHISMQNCKSIVAMVFECYLFITSSCIVMYSTAQRQLNKRTRVARVSHVRVTRTFVRAHTPRTYVGIMHEACARSNYGQLCASR